MLDVATTLGIRAQIGSMKVLTSAERLGNISVIDATDNSAHNLIAIHPNTNFAFVGNLESRFIQGLSITNGTAANTGSAVDVTEPPLAISIDRGGKFLYVVQPSILKTFAIADNGSLGTPSSIEIPHSNGILFDPTDQFMYLLTDEDNTVKAYSLLNGQITWIQDSAPLDPTVLSMAIDPNGNFIIVANSTGTVSKIGLGQSGNLEGITLGPVANDLTSIQLLAPMVIDPSGTFVIVTYQNLGDSTTYLQSIRISDMSLNGAALSILDSQPTSLSFDAVDSTLYLSGHSNAIDVYSVDALNGNITPF